MFSNFWLPNFLYLIVDVSLPGAKELSSYESEKRPIAVYEFAGSLAIESNEFNLYMHN